MIWFGWCVQRAGIWQISVVSIDCWQFRMLWHYSVEFHLRQILKSHSFDYLIERKSIAPRVADEQHIFECDDYNATFYLAPKAYLYLCDANIELTINKKKNHATHCIPTCSSLMRSGSWLNIWTIQIARSFARQISGSKLHHIAINFSSTVINSPAISSISPFAHFS